MEITHEMVDWIKFLTDHPEYGTEDPLGALYKEHDDDYCAVNSVLCEYLTDEAHNQVIKEYAPTYVSLYYVDYRDNLDNEVKLLEKCVQKNSLQPIEEHIYDWWDFPEGYYLEEIKKQMEADGLDELYETLYEDFRQYLWDHDDSEPTKELLRNTGNLTFFYDLGVEIEAYPEPSFFGSTSRYESYDMSYYKVRRALKMTKNHPSVDAVKSLVDNQTYSGDLRLYFSLPLESVIAGHLYDENSEDFKSLKVCGSCFVGIANPTSGASWFEEINNLDFEIPFDRENLHLSEIDHYSMEEICGLSSDWADKSGAPQFSLEPPKSKRKIKKSNVNSVVSQENEYDRVFKAGGCTAGDMDMRRHRDVYYDNNIPCGWHCPHCGTFWVD